MEELNKKNRENKIITSKKSLTEYHFKKTTL